VLCKAQQVGLQTWLPSCFKSFCVTRWALHSAANVVLFHPFSFAGFIRLKPADLIPTFLPSMSTTLEKNQQWILNAILYYEIWPSYHSKFHFHIKCYHLNYLSRVCSSLPMANTCNYNIYIRHLPQVSRDNLCVRRYIQQYSLLAKHTLPFYILINENCNVSLVLQTNPRLSSHTTRKTFSRRQHSGKHRMQKSYIALELLDKIFNIFFIFWYGLRYVCFFLNHPPVSGQAIWRPCVLSKAKQ